MILCPLQPIYTKKPWNVDAANRVVSAQYLHYIAANTAQAKDTQTAMPPHFLLPLLLVLLSCSSPSVLGGGHEHEYTLVSLKSLKPKATCSGHRVTPPENTTWVPLNHPHGPCSPLSDAASSTAPSLAELLHHDQFRIDDIHMRLSGNPGASDARKRSAGSRTFQKYGSNVAINLGGGRRHTSISMQVSGAMNASAAGRSSLPGVVQTVVLDTASDVPWVQCVPCPIPPCHPQTDSFYDPSRSPTSAPFSCNSPTCTGLGPYANGCVNGQCQYRVVYPDGSSTSGSYIADLLTFDARTSLGGFKFGCSHAEQGGGFDPNAAGILALGGGTESLLAQTASTYGNVFSYCTPATSSNAGFFTLGVPNRATFRYVLTPMVRFAVPTFYGVLLRDISVNGQQLGVAPAVFAPGTVLDSRTAFTRLPPTAYQALRTAFRNSMAMYRMAPPKGSLDTCYDFTGVTNVMLPKIAFVFDRNAVVMLDPSGILVNDCLAFTSNAVDSVPGVLGSVQQQTIEVLYNVGGGSVGFRQGAC